ncbi:MAG: adenylate kinase [Anaerolineaceae bacterium]|jgi:adenylate kinase|nr:adenylate kinase [Anaerolineaceae bacterium]
MYIVLLGPPGAGKGTQASLISEKTGLVHISSGDIFRENLKNDTPLGLEAKGYMERGELVPDDLTIAMVKDRLSKSDCKQGALLDGFPRTPAQAAALSAMLAEWDKAVDLVPYISVPEEELIERLSGRWTSQTGRVYHVKYNPPKIAGRCDVDGSPLFQREDDKPETVKNRIKVYFQQTAPLIDYYKEQGLLVEIDGTQSIEEVGADLLAAIEQVK